MLPTPLQITICSHAEDMFAGPVRDTIIECFQGGGSGYLGGGDDLEVPVRQFSKRPRQTPEDHLAGPLHCLCIVLVGQKLVEDDDFVGWINQLGAQIEDSDETHRFLVIDTDGTLGGFMKKAPATSWSQATILNELGERSVRETIAGLIALNLALKAITAGSPIIPDKLKFFVSHAKIDGQPLARMLSSQIQRLPGFGTFYDYDDIEPGANWQTTLRNGIESSVVIILRSDVYDTRTWCVQEVQWANEFGSPVVVVDLRNSLMIGPSELSLDSNPTVRVPDGNMYRIIFAGLREALRVRQHIRAVQHFLDRGDLSAGSTKVLVRRPTMRALQAACQELVDLGLNGAAPTIIYPDPPLEDGDFSAANALVGSAADTIRLTTPETLITSI